LCKPLCQQAVRSSRPAPAPPPPTALSPHFATRPGFTALRNNRRFHRTSEQRRVHRTLEHGPTARDTLARPRTPCVPPGVTAVLAAPSSRRTCPPVTES